MMGMLAFIPFALAQAVGERQTSLKEQIPLKVAILPVSIHSPEDLTYIREGLVDMLSSRVELSGRVAVLEKGVVKKALDQFSGEMDSETARKLGQELDADFVVFGSLTKLGDSASLDLKVLEVKGEKPGVSVFVQAKKMDEVIARVDDIARKVDEKVLGYALSPPVAEKIAEAPKETVVIPAAPPVLRPAVPATPEKSAIAAGTWKSQTVPFQVKGMAIGDVDGDGRNEVVLIEERKLWIYRFEKELKLLKKIEGGRFDKYLAVDVGDLQKEGKAAIFVTNLQGDRLSSFVVAYRDGDFRIISKGLDWFLRVVDWGEKGKVLLGQSKGIKAGWEGPLYELGWDGKGYKEIRRAEVPKGPTIYGFAPFVFDGKMAYSFIDADLRLKAMDQKGKVIWKSASTFGSDNGFQAKPMPNTFGYDEGDQLAYVNVRVISRGEELFIIRNKSPTGEFLKRARYYSAGEVLRLVWSGAMFLESWKSSELPGYVVDFQIQDLAGSREKELVVAVNLPKDSILSMQKNSALMVTRLQGAP
jgi:TolB-like protein